MLIVPLHPGRLLVSGIILAGMSCFLILWGCSHRDVAVAVLGFLTFAIAASVVRASVRVIVRAAREFFE